MIRSNLPLPFLYRLRLQAGAAARQATSSPVNYRGTRPAGGGSRPASARSAAIRRAATGDAAQLWLHFIDQYEAFTDILCAAAKSGCDGRRESDYAQLRRWFVSNYYRTAGRVRPYLEAEFDQETALPSVVDYAGQKRALDALEALFLPPTLRETLRHDTGDLIPRVARISEAVYRCTRTGKKVRRFKTRQSAPCPASLGWGALFAEGCRRYFVWICARMSASAASLSS